MINSLEQFFQVLNDREQLLRETCVKESINKEMVGQKVVDADGMSPETVYLKKINLESTRIFLNPQENKEKISKNLLIKKTELLFRL